MSRSNLSGCSPSPAQTPGTPTRMIHQSHPIGPTSRRPALTITRGSSVIVEFSTSSLTIIKLFCEILGHGRPSMLQNGSLEFPFDSRRMD
jgi:hypothetical protein